MATSRSVTARTAMDGEEAFFIGLRFLFATDGSRNRVTSGRVCSPHHIALPPDGRQIGGSQNLATIAAVNRTTPAPDAVMLRDLHAGDEAALFQLDPAVRGEELGMTSWGAGDPRSRCSPSSSPRSFARIGRSYPNADERLILARRRPDRVGDRRSKRPRAARHRHRAPRGGPSAGPRHARDSGAAGRGRGREAADADRRRCGRTSGRSRSTAGSGFARSARPRCTSSMEWRPDPQA